MPDSVQPPSPTLTPSPRLLSADEARALVGSYPPVSPLAALKDIGTGTSSNLFCRNMGSSFGTAIFGAILSNRLVSYVHHDLPAQLSSQMGSGGGTSLSRTALQQADAQAAKNGFHGLFDIVVRDFTSAMSVVFVSAAAIMVIAFVLSFFLKQVELRSAKGGAGKAPAKTEDLAPAVH